MAVAFRVSRHAARNVSVIEILVDGAVAGVLYPMGDKGVKLVSTHVSSQIVEDGFAGEVIEDDGSSSWPPIPAIKVNFEPGPYIIAGKKVLKVRSD